MSSPTSELRYLDMTPKWKRFGRPELTPPDPPGDPADPRNSLVYGSYIPGWTANTVGARTVDPITGSTITFENIYGDATTKTFTAVGGTTYKNKKFWCKVATTTGSADIWFENCYFANRKPEDMYASSASTNGGCVQNYGNNPPHLFFKDCTFNPKMWFDAASSAYWGHPVQIGIHGGNFDCVRSEFVNCQDGLNYVGPALIDNANAASCLFEANWVHKNFYMDDWTGPGAPSDNHTHSDAIQFNTGKNIIIRYNMLGGTRDRTGYDATPAYNSGDDALNAGMMVAQEGGTADYQHLGPLYVGYNWMGGGAATLNVFLKNSNVGSDWTFEHNRIMAPRGTSFPAGAGFQIYRKTGITSSFLNNVQWDISGSIFGTGVAALINNY